MLALLLEAPGRFSVRTVEDPKPARDGIVLDVTHCAICRTDAKICLSGHRDLSLPRIPGHEICAANFADGRRYAVWPGDSCGRCRFCRSGRENLCREMKIIGFHRDGGLAQKISARRENLLPIPASLPGEIAALAEPLACAINAVGQAAPGKQDKILVYGAGSLGLLIAMALAESGVKPLVCDVSEEKIRMSSAFRRTLGVRAVLVENLRLCADVVFNATSSPDAFGDGLRRLNNGGRFCFFSGLPSGISVPSEILNEVHYRQISLSGAYGCTRLQMKKALKILSENLDAVRRLIHRTVGIEDSGGAMRQILEGRSQKTIVEFPFP